MNWSRLVGMRPCKPLNGLQQGDLSFEKISDFLWLVLRSKIAFWKITSGNSRYTVSHTFEPKSARIVHFRGQLRITSLWLLWTWFRRVFELEIDSPFWWQPFRSWMEMLNIHESWDRHKSVPILVHGVGTLLWRFIKKVRDIKKLEFSSQEQAGNARDHDLWKDACLWAFCNASGPLFFQN